MRASLGLSCLLVACSMFLASRSARGDFLYADFSNTTGLNLVSSAAQSGSVINLSGLASSNLVGAIWRTDKQPVAAGFTAQFSFRAHSRGGANAFTTPVIEAGADGVVLVIQNSSATAVGAAGGGIGYEGIANSVAIEFDTFFNTDYFFLGNPVATGNGDSDGQHVAVHSNGAAANSAASSSRRGQLALAANLLEDGAVHTAKVVYKTSPTPSFDIYIDNLATPVTNIPFNLATELTLDPGGTAFVGLTSATGTAFEIHELQSFSFASVPEPSLGLIPLLGALALLRRRR